MTVIFLTTLESVLSLIPSAQAVPPNITTASVPQVNVGVPMVDQVINPVLEQTMTPPPQAEVNPMEVLLTVACAICLAGMAVMLINFLVRYWRTKHLVRASVPLEPGGACATRSPRRLSWECCVRASIYHHRYPSVIGIT